MQRRASDAIAFDGGFQTGAASTVVRRQEGRYLAQLLADRQHLPGLVLDGFGMLAILHSCAAEAH